VTHPSEIRSPWRSIDAPTCPRCHAAIDPVDLELAQYGLPFDEWREKLARARQGASFGFGGWQVGSRFRYDERRPWIRLACQSCDAPLRAGNPDVPSGRLQLLAGIGIGTTASLLVSAAWLQALGIWSFA
jgi:hypothetical protein